MKSVILTDGLVDLIVTNKINFRSEMYNSRINLAKSLKMREGLDEGV